MTKLFQAKVKGSTLPETLISMVIIMAVFSAAIVIYMRITASGVSLTGHQIQGEMESFIQETEDANQFIENVREKDEIRYHKSVESYREFRDLVVIRVTAEQNGRIVGELRKVVSSGH